jgi:RNA polymerase sigma-70 factor (ECF subfamily)
VLEGRRGAFDVLVERHRRPVYQVCFRFTRSHEDASDLTQEVFLRAFRSLASFQGRAALSTWLYRIAVNAALSRHDSSRVVHEAIENVPGLAAPGEAADARLVRAEQAARVRDAVARLPARQRATLILRVYQELPHEEIAQILGGSVGTAKANFFHALRNLRRLLGEGGPR